MFIVVVFFHTLAVLDTDITSHHSEHRIKKTQHEMLNRNARKRNHRNHKIDTSIHMKEMLQFRHSHGILLHWHTHTQKMVAHLMRECVCITVIISFSARSIALSLYHFSSTKLVFAEKKHLKRHQKKRTHSLGKPNPYRCV